MPTDTAQHPVTGSALLADAELVARVGLGDALAFEAIMRRHNRLLFRNACGVVGDDAEAQDVVQETYLRAFASMHSFRADAALGTWLARIGHPTIGRPNERFGEQSCICVTQAECGVRPNPFEGTASGKPAYAAHVKLQGLPRLSSKTWP